MSAITLYWFAFIAIFIIVYAIDMYVTSHKRGPVSMKSSLTWVAVWVSIALLFGLSLYFFFPQNPFTTVATGPVMMSKFIAGYFTEYSLSIDNLFVFILIFSMMGIHQKNQPKLLKIGILISIILRILFIVLGMELVERFHWIIYIFGAILIWTAYKMAFSKGEDSVNPESNILYRLASKFFRIDPDIHSSKFFTRIDGKLYITNIFLALLVIGSTDILFAIDSIPAIIGVIKEGSTNILTLQEENFIAISSNMFAVMGLISLFFALKGVMGMFRYLKVGVSVILLFIGVKMLLGAFEPVSNFFAQRAWLSLVVIASILFLSILLSIAANKREEALLRKQTIKSNKHDKSIITKNQF